MTSQSSTSSLSATTIPDQDFESATVAGSGAMLLPLDGLVYGQEYGQFPGTQVADVYTRDMGMSGKYALFNSFEEAGVDVFTISSLDGSNFGISSLDLSTQLRGIVISGREGASSFVIESLSDGAVVATAQIDARMSASGGGITYTLQTANPYMIAGGRITFDPAAGWGNIDTIRIRGQGGDFATIALDNLDIEPVPTPPVVTGVSASTANGSYKVGDVVMITVTYDSIVNVTGAPTLMLETGSVDRVATYVSGSGGRTLTFSYTVQAGDLSSDLDYLNADALSLNGGTIKDIYRNDASLKLPAAGTSASLSGNKAIVVDGAAPAVTQVTVNGDQVTVSYSEVIQGAGADWTGSFKVLVEGYFADIRTIATVANKVVITLAEPVKHAQSVLVNYISQGGRIQDTVGNAAQDVTHHLADNQTPAPPTPVIEGVSIADGDFAVGEQVTATITVAADVDVYTLVTGRIGGYELSGLTKVDDTTYTAVFTVTEGGQSFARGQDIPVSLTVKGSADNQSLGYTATVTQGNGSIDTVKPVVAAASVMDNRIVVTYSEALDAAAGANALASGFIVKVDGQDVAIAGRAFGSDGKSIVLTLAAPVIKGQSVSVSYRDPTPADDADAIQDVAGNDAASFTDARVHNITGSKLVDGVDVLSSVITNPDGSRTHVIQTGFVQPGRVDQSGPSAYADIPIAGLDRVEALLAQLGDGSGLDARITRAELMSVLLRAFNVETGGVSGSTFSDVTGEWASAYIASAAAMGIQSNVVGIDLAGLPSRDTILTGSSASSNLMVLNASQDGVQRRVEINDVGFIALKGNAEIYGGNGAQFIVGDAASQRIVMGADDDTIHGGAGDDYVGS
ncbi:SwmB domain-containing protein, partial [Microvirga sp. Mcv34]|uniref:SwmB domain-containing protein n=1 Tax=Microvirga sp. Mcv34 TaxID=2926016 RepID=UPI0021C9EE18